MEDNEILSLVIEDHSRTIKDLRSDVKKLKTKNYKLRAKVLWEEWWIGVALAFVAFGLCLMSHSCFSASDIPTHCYIRFSAVGSERYVLQGSLDWSSDIDYGRYDTISEALEAAESLNCIVLGSQNWGRKIAP